MNFPSNLKLLRPLCLCLLLLCVVARADAQSSTFANFTEAGDQGFVFQNSGDTSSFTSTPINVNFFYNVANNYGPLTSSGATNVIPATLVISGEVDKSAFEDSQDNIYQNFSSITLQFTGSNGQDLLTVTDSAAPAGASPTFDGSQNSETGEISSSTSSRFAQKITYSSSYLTFFSGSGIQDNFGLTFSSLLDGASKGPTINANGFLDSFAASGSGTFASSATPTIVTPEPNPAITMGIAILSLLVLALIRFKKNVTA